MLDPEQGIQPADDSRMEKLLHQETYTPDEAATLLDMSVQRIYSAAYKGELKAHIIGNDVISIERGDLLAWLRGQV